MQISCVWKSFNSFRRQNSSALTTKYIMYVMVDLMSKFERADCIISNQLVIVNEGKIKCLDCRKQIAVYHLVPAILGKPQDVGKLPNWSRHLCSITYYHFLVLLSVNIGETASSTVLLATEVAAEVPSLTPPVNLPCVVPYLTPVSFAPASSHKVSC